MIFRLRYLRYYGLRYLRCNVCSSVCVKNRKLRNGTNRKHRKFDEKVI